MAGAFIGTFVGDALGMPVEGWHADRIRREFGELDEMLDARLGPGTFTDDTQMMVATARSILACEEPDPDHLARSFLEHYEQKRGYGSGTTQVFQKWRRGVDVDKASKQIFDGGSFGNGGSMRIAPVGVLYGGDPEQLTDAIRTACGITHAHPLGLGGSFLQARTVGLAFRGSTPIPAEEWVDTLQADLPEAFDEDDVLQDQLERMRSLLERGNGPVAPGKAADRLGCTSRAFESVPAAIYAFLANAASFRDAVVYAVSIGGDTDTIGAMTGAIAGARHGVGAVPKRWWVNLENGPDGRNDILDLAVDFSRLVDERSEENG